MDVASYTYDGANRLTDYSRYGDDGTTLTGQWSYQYNGYGDRVSQTDVLNNYTTDYLLDLTSGLTQVLGEFTPDDDTYYLMGLDVLGQQNGQGWGYYGYDGLGSMRGMFDSNANLVQSSMFGPYGNPIIDTGYASSLGYTGEMQDSSGLVYLRARMYDPMSGVFLQKDPFPGYQNRVMSMNGYSYVEGNVTNWTDPSGLTPLDDINRGLSEAGIAAASAIISMLQDNGEHIAKADNVRRNLVCTDPTNVLNVLCLDKIGDPMHYIMGMVPGASQARYDQERQALDNMSIEEQRAIGFGAVAGPLSNIFTGLTDPTSRTISSINDGWWADAFIGAFDIMTFGTIHEIREGLDTNINGECFTDRLGGGVRWLTNSAMLAAQVYGGYGTYSNSRFAGWLDNINPNVMYTGIPVPLFSRSPWRGKITIPNGNQKMGWVHIEGRHITGTIPGIPGHTTDFFKLGTTRQQITKAAQQIIDKGVRTSNPLKVLQTFERRMTINGFSANYKVVVNSLTEEVITMYPIEKSARIIK